MFPKLEISACLSPDMGNEPALTIYLEISKYEYIPVEIPWEDFCKFVLEPRHWDYASEWVPRLRELADKLEQTETDD